MSADMVLVSWGIYTLPTGAMFDVMAAWPHGRMASGRIGPNGPSSTFQFTAREFQKWN